MPWKVHERCTSATVSPEMFVFILWNVAGESSEPSGAFLCRIPPTGSRLLVEFHVVEKWVEGRCFLLMHKQMLDVQHCQQRRGHPGRPNQTGYDSAGRGEGRDGGGSARRAEL